MEDVIEFVRPELLKTEGWRDMLNSWVNNLHNMRSIYASLQTISNLDRYEKVLTDINFACTEVDALQTSVRRRIDRYVTFLYMVTSGNGMPIEPLDVNVEQRAIRRMQLDLDNFRRSFGSVVQLHQANLHRELSYQNLLCRESDLLFT